MEFDWAVIDRELWKYRDNAAYGRKFYKLLQSPGGSTHALMFVVTVATPQPGFYDTFIGRSCLDFYLGKDQKERARVEEQSKKQLVFSQRVEIAQQHETKFNYLMLRYLGNTDVDKLLEFAADRESARPVCGVVASKIQTMLTTLNIPFSFKLHNKYKCWFNHDGTVTKQMLFQVSV